MKRGWTFVAVLAVLTLMPLAAQARGRGSRSGKVYGAGGLMYDTNSADWKAAGGNINVYQQMMAQKAMMAQQKLMMQQMAKQQQAFQKWYKDQKSKKDKGQPTDPAFDRYNQMVDRQNEMLIKQAQSFRSPAQRATSRRSKTKTTTSSATPK